MPPRFGGRFKAAGGEDCLGGLLHQNCHSLIGERRSGRELGEPALPLPCGANLRFRWDCGPAAPILRQISTAASTDPTDPVRSRTAGEAAPDADLEHLPWRNRSFGQASRAGGGTASTAAVVTACRVAGSLLCSRCNVRASTAIAAPISRVVTGRSPDVRSWEDSSGTWGVVVASLTEHTLLATPAAGHHTGPVGYEVPALLLRLHR